MFGIIDVNIRAEVKEVNELDRLLVKNWDDTVVFKRKEFSSKFWRDIRLKESLLYQKSRALWIKEGNVNSKYFHSLLR